MIIEIRTGSTQPDYQPWSGYCYDQDAMHPEGLKLFDGSGGARGFVDPKCVDGRPALEDFWVMQGSICDLRCKHCYTASSPTNNRLQQITADELRPHLEAAASFGAQKI